MCMLGNKAIKIIRESIKTHIAWAEYFEKYPYQEKKEQYIKIGNAKFHRKCIIDYTLAIREITQLQSENKT